MIHTAAARDRGHRRVALLLTVVLASAGASLPAPAAATAYRYWTYWTAPAGGPAWTFSQVGPASTVPKHGAVEGWRFSMSTGTRGQGSQPRIDPAQAFRQFCAARPAPAGEKRVAVVFDFGEASDAPDGQTPPQARGTCVQIERSATGGEILSRAGDVRVEAGLVCAIAGYPRGECAPAVPTPGASSEPEPKKKAVPKQADDGKADDDGGTSDGRPRDVTPNDPDTGNPDTEDPGATGPDSAGTDDGGTDNSGSRRDGSAPSEPAGRTPSPDASVPTPTAASASVSPAPVFVADDAHADEPAGPRWGLAAAVLALAAVGAYLLLRRRPRH